MIRFPPRRILVGYDRSALSVTALKHAAALAERCGAALELAYVEPWQSAGGVPGGGLYVSPTLSPVEARRIRDEIREEVGPGPKITVTEGDPAARLLHLARAHHADMIVAGTHGRRGLARVLLGSVAEEIIRSSPVPVYVARGPVKAIEDILAPVHFTSYANHGFLFAAGAAEALGARLTALHVDLDPVWGGNALMRLRRLVETLPPGRRERCEARVVLDEDACAGIVKASGKHDLIVLVAHRRSALKDAFLGMTAEKILRTSKKPLLIVPPPVRESQSLPAAENSRAAKSAPMRSA